MTAKKKVSDEAGDATEVVDEAPVDEAPDVDETVDTEPVEKVEESTPVEEPVEAVDDGLAIAQSILKIPSDGKMNHSTKMALRKFQRENGLVPSGAFDEATKSKMHIQTPA